MRDKAAEAAKKAAPIMRALLALSVSSFVPGAFAQLVDPMAPPGIAPARAAGASGLGTELQAIISGPGRRLALINGNVVQVGEPIPGDGVLLGIGADSATIRSGDRHVELHLHPALRAKKETAR